MKVNKNTKKGQYWIDSYNSSHYAIGTCEDIYSVYQRPSYNKIMTLYKHIRYIDSVDGYCIKILSFNCQSYVIGYITEKDNEKYLNIVTYLNHYEIKL